MEVNGVFNSDPYRMDFNTKTLYLFLIENNLLLRYLYKKQEVNYILKKIKLLIVFKI